MTSQSFGFVIFPKGRHLFQSKHKTWLGLIYISHQMFTNVNHSELCPHLLSSQFLSSDKTTSLHDLQKNLAVLVSLTKQSLYYIYLLIAGGITASCIAQALSSLLTIPFALLLEGQSEVDCEAWSRWNFSALRNVRMLGWKHNFKNDNCCVLLTAKLQNHSSSLCCTKKGPLWSIQTWWFPV